ncbi:hypothetical protein [Chryseobacterium sp. FH1]|uniref:hypothetical protein n=1 Tax=Chryseobacterium sp. FH1 TaxID=1233951 RepID=UPI0004E3FF39|nr:hypothetical protein [Chryseobacterium sp. FH1]KFC19292.1 hypothetical protein IO90_08255 [Chryseobacterium sp. FH1]
MNDINGEHSQNSYFEELSYKEYQKRDILNENNGKINFSEIKDRLKEIRNVLPHYNRKEIISLEEKFYDIKSYEEKLQFWIDKDLGLINTDLSYIKKDKNKKFRIPFAIEPIDDVEDNLYFNYLLKWFNENTVNSKIKYFTFETLKTNLLDSGQLRKKLINTELNQTKNRINDLISNEQFFMQKFVDGFRLNQNLLTDLYDGYLTTDKIIVIAYLLSPVLGYLEYEKFLNEKLKNEDFISEVIMKSEEKGVKGNPVLKEYTFRKIHFFTTENLDKLRTELITKNIIEDISFDDFKDIFSEQPTTKVKSRIIWKLENKRSSATYIRYDWQSLLSLINEVVEPDFVKYKGEIKELLKWYFDFPDNTLSNKIEDSFSDYLTTFEKNHRKSTKEIIEIFKKINK